MGTPQRWSYKVPVGPEEATVRVDRVAYARLVALHQHTGIPIRALVDLGCEVVIAQCARAFPLNDWGTRPDEARRARQQGAGEIPVPVSRNVIWRLGLYAEALQTKPGNMLLDWFGANRDFWSTATWPRDKMGTGLRNDLAVTGREMEMYKAAPYYEPPPPADVDYVAPSYKTRAARGRTGAQLAALSRLNAGAVDAVDLEPEADPEVAAEP